MCPQMSTLYTKILDRLDKAKINHGTTGMEDWLNWDRSALVLNSRSNAFQWYRSSALLWLNLQIFWSVKIVLWVFHFTMVLVPWFKFFPRHFPWSIKPKVPRAHPWHTDYPINMQIWSSWSRITSRSKIVTVTYFIFKQINYCQVPK